MWSFHAGGNEFKFHNINDAKDFADEIRGLADATATDLSKHLNDLCFEIEGAYQRYHNLSPDDWSKVH